MHFRIIATDVTDYGTLHCVAGWDVLTNRMVRPEPAPQAFWEAGLVGPDKPFWPGHVLEFDGDVPKGQPFPHATEDVIVRPNSLRRVDRIGLAELPSQVAGSVEGNLEALFAPELVESGSGAHVPAGAKCRSLGAIEIDRSLITFSENNWDGKRKLRAIVQDAKSGKKMNLGITSTTYRRVYFDDGLHAVAALLPDVGNIHLRIGLSRPFGARPAECFVQINGLYAV